jgi:hypothetical protein
MATLSLRQPLLQRISWGALFAGFFFGFGIWMILLALGAGIGFSAFNPRDLSNWQGLGIGFGIWGVISGIIALFLAAWLTARVGNSESKLAGMLHGAALWGFMLVAGIWVAAMAVGTAAGTAAEAAAATGAAADTPTAPEPGAQVQQQEQGLAQQLEQRSGEVAETAKTAGATGAWAFFIYGLLTLAAAILGGRYGVAEDRHVVVREETAPGAPLPQRV